jgi:hypothetical protein
MPDPQRLTPTQRLHEVTMAALTRSIREPECSVDLTLNAKGDVQISVGAKAPFVEEAMTVSLLHVGAAVEAEFDRLCAKYPRVNGDSAK